jgi:hypothetical protein
LEGCFVDVSLISSVVELTSDFSCGTFGIPEKLDELAPTISLKPLGDVGRNRDRRFPELVPQREILRERSSSRHLINLIHQFHARLPRIYVFEPLNHDMRLTPDEH